MAGCSWEENLKKLKSFKQAKGKERPGRMCTTRVEANFPVARQCGPGLGVALGWRRWKLAGAVIRPGSGVLGCAGLFGANCGRGATALASHEPPRGSCVLRGAASKPEEWRRQPQKGPHACSKESLWVWGGSQLRQRGTRATGREWCLRPAELLLAGGQAPVPLLPVVFTSRRGLAFSLNGLPR